MAVSVGIIMGSQSDWPTMKAAAEILDELGIAYEAKIVSAHRTPDRLWDYGKTAVATLQVGADGETVGFQLCGLRTGVVAIRLFQDINGNGKLDTNAFGIPSEPYGASGKPPAFSAPTWETTQVPVDGKPVVVKLSK